MKKAVRAPKQKRSIQTKARIMDAGMKLFSEKGFHNTHSNEIAKEAGVAVGSFYAYFPDKKELFLEIMQTHWEEQFATIELPPEDLDTLQMSKREMIYNLLNSIVGIHDIAPNFHQEQFVVAHTVEEIQEKLIEWDQLGLEFSKNYLRCWKDHLRIKDVEAAAMIWNTTMEENIHHIKFAKTNMEQERLLQELTDLLHAYLFGS